ncbi:MAG: hypothetical protein K0S39_2491 [Paenibacillus sp.]|jgi:predicted dehydrogenase|nr:hypothetical protein [Paenibacillus sp.]
MIHAALIGAGHRGVHCYAPYALQHPDEIRFTAVAEPDAYKRERFAKQHNIPVERQFASWQELLAQPKLAEALLICTSDDQHYEPTMLALEKGYHILLEKPMSPRPKEAVRMALEAEKRQRLLMVCHVLRYTPFFTKVKELIEGGEIGRIMSVQWNENVGFWHQAHSFVRGNWRNAGMSSPMILAKCCHDMDMLQWLIDDECLRVSSFGSLSYFRKENAPEGSTERCTDGCPVEKECVYSALKWYYNEKEEWPSVIASPEPALEARMKAIQEGPYGRCVYRCDNDVVDHQVVNLEFRNGTTVAFTMSAFTKECNRTLKIMGTRGELHAHMEHNEIEIIPFDGGSRYFVPEMVEGRHGGGDYLIMKQFVDSVTSGKLDGGRTSGMVSAQSHLISFAAEESRLSGKIITMKEYMSRCL